MQKWKNLFKKIIIQKFRLRKINIEKQKNILNNFLLLLKRGYSLTETAKLVASKNNLSKILFYLKEGYPFTEVLKYYNFDNDILLIIKIGENTGQLKESIERSINLLNKKINNKSLIWEKLKYPLMLALILLGSIFFVTTFLFPTFFQVYDSFHIKLSTPLQIMVVILNFLPKILGMFIIFIIIIFYYFQKKSLSERVKIFTKNRFIRKYFYQFYNHVFIINLSLLLELHIRLDEIFLLFTKQSYNYLLSKEAEKIYTSLLDGEELYKILEKRKIYNHELIEIIKEGESNGTLVLLLKNYLLLLNHERKKKSQKYLFLIQPIFYGLFGFMIIFLYAAIFLPMFQMMDQMK